MPALPGSNTNSKRERSHRSTKQARYGHSLGSIENEQLCEAMGGRDVRAPYGRANRSLGSKQARCRRLLGSIENEQLCEAMGGGTSAL
ncbi:MAG: hypothetical protein K2X77_27085, partial [Candidatus Obscuribacterales bacterium]|nr:hypothetical protein [Candidatus Obscuribacterales bacterium]